MHISAGIFTMKNMLIVNFDVAGGSQVDYTLISIIKEPTSQSFIQTIYTDTKARR